MPSAMKDATANKDAHRENVELSDGGSEDDEQTLQLKLQAIEAKLRLKKLQKQKANSTQEHIHVPSSPKRTSRNQPASAKAPAERPVKTALSARERLNPAPRPSVQDTRGARGAPSKKDSTPLRPRSFNERLAEARHSDDKADLRRQQTKRAQSKDFGIEHARPGSPPPATNEEAGKSTTKDRDTHSGLYLSRRFIEAGALDEAFEDKDIYTLPRLLKEVISPAYEPPETDADFVVFGVIASKSSPRNQVGGKMGSSKEEDQVKFLILHLTDLEWEIDLFLFGRSFDTFRKLSVGSVIAILNPRIMPPKPHMRDTGRFSLKLSSGDDAVLEIGSAAHLGFCPSIKKDGSECGSWYDSRKVDHCEFHINLAIERSRAGRMETNTMHGFSLFSQPGKKSGGKGRGSNGKGKRPNSPQKGLYRDSEAQSYAYMVPPELQRGASAARLLDSEDIIRHSGSNPEELRRKRLAAKESERKLAQQLGSRSAGPARAEAASRTSAHASTRPKDDQMDAKSLGLIGPKGAGFAASRHTTSHGVGWSAAFKRGLPETSVQGPSPKKARFDLGKKGVREPGRDSLDGARATKPRRLALDDDDDDGLDIV